MFHMMWRMDGEARRAGSCSNGTEISGSASYMLLTRQHRRGLAIANVAEACSAARKGGAVLIARREARKFGQKANTGAFCPATSAKAGR